MANSDCDGGKQFKCSLFLPHKTTLKHIHLSFHRRNCIWCVFVCAHFVWMASHLLRSRWHSRAIRISTSERRRKKRKNRTELEFKLNVVVRRRRRVCVHSITLRIPMHYVVHRFCATIVQTTPRRCRRRPIWERKTNESHIPCFVSTIFSFTCAFAHYSRSF